MLCPGTFTVGDDIDYANIGSGKVLRGYSPERTRLVLTNGFINMRGIASENALTIAVDLSQDAVKGSTVLQLGPAHTSFSCQNRVPMQCGWPVTCAQMAWR